MRGLQKKRRLIAVLTIMIAIVPLEYPCTAQVESADRDQALELELTTDKAVYKSGERIVVTITLHNNGDRIVWSQKRLGVLCWDLGLDHYNAFLEVRDSAGVQVKPSGCPVSDRVFGQRMSTPKFVAFIKQTHRLFLPGDFVGTTVALQMIGYKELSPGRYRLGVLYWQQNYDDLLDPKQFQDVKEKLEFAWWAEVKSNWVEIEVQP